MSLITVTDLGIAFGAQVVLEGLDLRIEERDRLAVVGGNGAGKTSLLDVLAGVTQPASGRVDRDRRLIAGYLPQDAPTPVAPTVLAEVMASRTDIAALAEEMAALEARMSTGGDHLDATLERYGEVQHRYEGLGGYDLEARARAALGGLGLTEAELARHPRELSGGQVRRLELAKLLMLDADLLIVDEPTNHLDLAAIEWLEEFVRALPAALVLVSHDRRFLDRVCTRVLELSHQRGEEYAGSYSAYVRQRGERRARRAKEYEEQQAYISHQEEFIRRYRAGQRAKQARGRQTLLDRLERVAPVREEERPRLRFSQAPGSGQLLRAEHLLAGRGAPLVSLERAVLTPGDRVAIVGPNGCGKSTLLHTLAGELEPVGGRLLPGSRLVRRLYRQDHGHLDPERTVLEELLADHPVGEERGRTLLGTLLFEGDDVYTRVGDLSGGERSRLALGKLSLEETNVLLLDEPTNHLDIGAQEVLEEALQQFHGAIVFVSHDRALIDAVATTVWAVEEAASGAPAPNRVRAVLGAYADLLRVREHEAAAATAAPSPAAPTKKVPSPRAPGAPVARRHTGPQGAPTTPPRAETSTRRAVRRPAHPAAVRRLEQEIADVEKDLADVRGRLADPATYADPAAGARAVEEHAHLEARLGDLLDRWAETAS